MRRLLTLLLHDVYERDPSESGFSGIAADRYKLAVKELDALLAAIAGVRDDRPVLVLEPSWEAQQGIPMAITVDDGGLSYYTAVAERLEVRSWRGHCLVTTGFIGRRGFLEARHLRELHARGHLIGTHSVSHPSRFAACKWEDMVREWADSRKALQDILGDDVTVGSIPGGHVSRRVAQAAHEAGLEAIFTSEPVMRIQHVGECQVVGRFTLRAGCQPEFSGQLASLQRSALFREWAAWNVKKVLKRFLGSGYPRLAEWAVRLSH